MGQIGVKHPEAAKIAEDAGMKVVMNRCPKIELFRPFLEAKTKLKDIVFSLKQFFLEKLSFYKVFELIFYFLNPLLQLLN